MKFTVFIFNTVFNQFLSEFIKKLLISKIKQGNYEQNN